MLYRPLNKRFYISIVFPMCLVLHGHRRLLLPFLWILNPFYSYFRNERTSSAYWNLRQSIEPRPRYAHQLVYDEEKGAHYIFGGNPGGTEGKVQE